MSALEPRWLLLRIAHAKRRRSANIEPSLKNVGSLKPTVLIK